MPAIPPSAPATGRADWEIFQRLLRVAAPYRKRLALGVIFGLLFGGSTVGFLPAIQKYLAGIFDLQAATAGETLAVAGVLLLLGAGRGVGYYISKYSIEWVGIRVVTELRVQCFERLQRQSVAYFARNKTGDLMSRITNDSMLVERAVSTVIGDLVQQPVVLLGALGYIFYLDWRLSLGMFVLFPLCLIPVTIFGRRVRRFSRESQASIGGLVSLLQENLVGIRIVKAFGLEQHEIEKFRGRALDVFRKLMKVARARASNDPVIVELSIAGLCAALFYARATDMPMNEFMVFAVSFLLLYEPVKKLSRINLQIQQSSGAAERIFDVLDADCDVRERPGASELRGPVESIAFENVSFSYGKEEVLADISFRVEQGQCLAIVGGSGSGKTTLVSLLPRFFDVASGRIVVNGIDLRDLTMSSLRANIGLVTQETILFNESVAENIRLGRMDATLEEIRDAARRAHAEEFIRNLPQGYDTRIGERGESLSGGERQRLCIARALLRNPPILILDEATSALDTESERLVQAALDELMADRTVFAIAHRLSTIQNADRILVLKSGRIEEAGTHEQLLEKNGAYRYFYDLQFDV
jgi:ATP-binding cassette, subfamily B, bacterial MsbA